MLNKGQANMSTKKIIIVIIISLWFGSLLPGLLLESQEIRNRYKQFGSKTEAQKEEEAVRVSAPGQIVNDYIIQTINDRDN